MNRILISFLIAFSLCTSIACWAQDTASIMGTVEDTSGAVVPNANVTISNPQKGFVRHLKSNRAGRYSISALPIGNYTVTAAAPGFQTLARSGIVLTVGAIQQVNMVLSVGSVTSTVSVLGNIPRVQTETAAVSQVITARQITQLDLNGRDFVSLALLVPGAAPSDSLNTESVGVNGNMDISFNGGSDVYNNWEIDGGNDEDEGSSSTLNTYPSVDSIAEFRISTSNYSAAMGRHAGAQIEVATKAGTKDFHGDLYEFNRNDAFDANPFFQNRVIAPPGGNAPKTPLTWNDYGFALGGPVYVPRLYNTDKSKTFFFWSEEWRAYRQGTVISDNAPTPLMRQGNFSQCDPKSGNYNPIVASGCVLPSPSGVTYDSVQQMPGYNGQAFTDATDLLNAYVPLPNNGVDGWTASPSLPTNWREDQIRIDQNISDKTSAFVRYTQDAWNTVVTPTLWAGGSYDTNETPFLGPGKSAVLHITHSFSPTFMNEFIMSYTVDHIVLGNESGPDAITSSFDRPSGFVMNHLYSANDSNPLVPDIDVSGGLPFSFYENTSTYTNANPIIEWKDNVAWVRGNHTFTAGFFLEKFRKNQITGANPAGTVDFYASGPYTTGNALADMFLGRIDDYSEGSEAINGVPVGGYGRGHWRMTDFEPYVGDTWKTTRRLTLTLGLRYYWFVPIHDVSSPTVDSNFMPNLYSPALAAQLDPLTGNVIAGTGDTYNNYGNGLVECGHDGIPKGCMVANTGTNFGPRFGFAWDPTGSGKTAIRGGYGIYYEAGNGNEADTEGVGGQAPVLLAPTVTNFIGYNNISSPSEIGPASLTVLPSQDTWPSEQQFNLGVQHSFGNNDLLGVSYVGMLGRHLGDYANGILNAVPMGAGDVTLPYLAGTNGCGPTGVCNVQNILINQQAVTSNFFRPYTNYNLMNVHQNTDTSNYNSLQVSYGHSFSHGFTYQLAYTWSHAMSDDNEGGIDPTDQSRWMSTSGSNRTQVLVMNYVYHLPFFTHSLNPFVRQSLGGWELSGITSFETGPPYDIGCGINGFSSGIGEGVRCNTIGPVKVQKGVTDDPEFGPTPTWYNPNNMAQPLESQLYSNGEPGMFGYMGANVLTGPGINDWDLALLKNFSVPWFKGEHSTLQFRLETFNTFNTPQWNGVNTGCSGSPNVNGTPAFGRPCGGTQYNLGIGEVDSTRDPRILQLALKWNF